MFSGIVEETAQVAALERRGRISRLTIRSALDHSDTRVGDSIAIDGVCLTVVELNGSSVAFELSEETLRRSTLGELHPGSSVNLERSLVMGGRVHGHLVSGHVDATVALTVRSVEQGGERFDWEFPPDLRLYLAPKGSVALAGVSLTVGEVQAGRFSVYIIPHTAQVTTLGSKRPGDRVNLEVDMLARYVRAALQERSGGVSLDLLREQGYLSEDER